jgi:hypothetical protein
MRSVGLVGDSIHISCFDVRTVIGLVAQLTQMRTFVFS